MLSPSTPFHPKQEPKGNDMCEPVKNAIDAFDNATRLYWVSGERSMRKDRDRANYKAARKHLDAAIEAAIQAERNSHGWQAIETAPRDGTVIDLLTKEGVRFTDEWWVEDDGAAFWTCLFQDDMFSHWMPLPLPAPPAAITEGS